MKHFWLSRGVSKKSVSVSTFFFGGKGPKSSFTLLVCLKDFPKAIHRYSDDRPEGQIIISPDLDIRDQFPNIF